jgi:hypothetical protein
VTKDLPPIESSPPPIDDDTSRASGYGPAQFATPGRPVDDNTDARPLWYWKSKYPDEARREIGRERFILLGYLACAIIFAALFLTLAGQSLQIPLGRAVASEAGSSGAGSPLLVTIEFRVVAGFFLGWVGGTTFAIKWLVHAVAKGKWHLDRRPWRLLVPLTGGVYSCVVLALLDGGMMGSGAVSGVTRPIAISAALSFLVGYFSDGVSGLLSNVANAVFGTLEKK